MQRKTDKKYVHPWTPLESVYIAKISNSSSLSSATVSEVKVEDFYAFDQGLGRHVECLIWFELSVANTRQTWAAQKFDLVWVLLTCCSTLAINCQIHIPWDLNRRSSGFRCSWFVGCWHCHLSVVSEIHVARWNVFQIVQIPPLVDICCLSRHSSSD